MTKKSFTLASLYCASWIPSPLSVAFLLSINEINYWLVIRWFRACSTSTHIFACIDLCCSMKRKSIPWVEACIIQPCFLSQVVNIVFWRQLFQDDSIMTLDPHFPYRWPVLSYLFLRKLLWHSYWAWECPTHDMILAVLYICVVSGFPCYPKLLSLHFDRRNYSFSKVFQPSSLPLISYFRVHFLYNKMTSSSTQRWKATWLNQRPQLHALTPHYC